jgi:hypothetical protein
MSPWFPKAAVEPGGLGENQVTFSTQVSLRENTQISLEWKTKDTKILGGPEPTQLSNQPSGLLTHGGLAQTFTAQERVPWGLAHAFTTHKSGWGLADAFTPHKNGCPVIPAFCARERGF